MRHCSKWSILSILMSTFLYFFGKYLHIVEYLIHLIYLLMFVLFTFRCFYEHYHPSFKVIIPIDLANLPLLLAVS